MRAPKTLYIVADGGRVRYIERTGLGHFSTFRKFASAQMHDKACELSHDRPGRVRESVGAARHALAAKVDPRDKVEVAFIRSVAEDLREDRTLDRFDSLVLIAPSKLQKVFRDSFAGKPVRCIAKDLTKVPDGDLHRHLPVLPFSQAAN